MTKREEIEILKQRLDVALRRIEALERDIAKIGKRDLQPPAPFDFETVRKNYEKMTRPQAPTMPIHPWQLPMLCGTAQGVKA